MAAFKAVIALLASSALLVASDAQVRDCRYKIPGCLATSEYNPMCGVNGCDYDNPGLAFCGGTQVAFKGYCYMGPPRNDQGMDNNW